MRVGPVTSEATCGGEEAVGVVRVERRACAHARGGGAADSVWRKPGAGVVFAAIDAIGVSGERVNVGNAFELHRERQQELAAAAAAAARSGRYRHRALAAGNQRDGRRERCRMHAHLAHERGIHLRDLAGLAGDSVAKNDRRNAGALENIRRRL